MALIKEKTINGGRDTISYWRWIQTNRSDIKKESHYVLGGWKDKAERNAYPNFPRDSYSFDWSGEDYPFAIDTLKEASVTDYDIAYHKAKENKLDENKNETNFFADAIDD